MNEKNKPLSLTDLESAGHGLYYRASWTTLAIIYEKPNEVTPSQSPSFSGSMEWDTDSPYYVFSSGPSYYSGEMRSLSSCSLVTSYIG